jgi:cation diffusion facilitator family transporter
MSHLRDTAGAVLCDHDGHDDDSAAPDAVHDHQAYHHREDAERSRDGIRTVAKSLAVLLAAAVVQIVIFLATGSIALLADLIHNTGDALTAVPVGIAFFLRSARAERGSGYAVVFAIFFSACAAGYEAVNRLVHPHHLAHLGVLAAAGVVGFVGNEIAAQVRLAGGKRLRSAALIADGKHARVDGFVSLSVVASAVVVALGWQIADPIIGLVITLVILEVTRDAWLTVRGHEHHH